jgi:hypothetical protein
LKLADTIIYLTKEDEELNAWWFEYSTDLRALNQIFTCNLVENSTM